MNSLFPFPSFLTFDKKIVQFARTPKMSTYLLAWAVGDFEYIEGRTSTGVRVRVYTTPGKKHLGAFALEVACKTLPYFNEYFDIEYPLEKCDMVSLLCSDSE